MGLRVGTVFKSYFGKAGKYKRYLIVSRTIDGRYVCCLLINSELTPFARQRPAIVNANIHLEVMGRENYLEWDNYLSCERVHKVKESELMVRKTNGLVQALGQMSGQDLDRVIQVLKKCGFHTLDELVEYGIVAEEDVDLEAAEE